MTNEFYTCADSSANHMQARNSSLVGERPMSLTAALLPGTWGTPSVRWVFGALTAVGSGLSPLQLLDPRWSRLAFTVWILQEDMENVWSRRQERKRMILTLLSPVHLLDPLPSPPSCSLPRHSSSGLSVIPLQSVSPSCSCPRQISPPKASYSRASNGCKKTEHRLSAGCSPHSCLLSSLTTLL